MKEQIKEMRKDLIEVFDEEYEKRRMITPDFTAEKMTAKGWRKQSEGEWIKQVKIRKEGKPVLHHYQCSLCGVYLATQANFCPNCGAKMKGALEMQPTADVAPKSEVEEIIDEFIQKVCDEYVILTDSDEREYQYTLKLMQFAKAELKKKYVAHRHNRGAM